MTRRQRDEARFVRELFQHQLRRDVPERGCLQTPHRHAARFQRQPRINVHRKVVLINHHLIARLPIEPGGHRAEPGSGGADECDFANVRAEHLRRARAGGAQQIAEAFLLVIEGSGRGGFLHRTRHARGHRRHAGVREIHLARAHGKLAPSQRFVVLKLGEVHPL